MPCLGLNRESYHITIKAVTCLHNNQNERNSRIPLSIISFPSAVSQNGNAKSTNKHIKKYKNLCYHSCTNFQMGILQAYTELERLSYDVVLLSMEFIKCRRHEVKGKDIRCYLFTKLRRKSKVSDVSYYL